MNTQSPIQALVSEARLKKQRELEQAIEHAPVPTEDLPTLLGFITPEKFATGMDAWNADNFPSFLADIKRAASKGEQEYVIGVGFFRGTNLPVAYQFLIMKSLLKTFQGMEFTFSYRPGRLSEKDEPYYDFVVHW